MKADVTLTRNQAIAIVASIAVTLENCEVPKKDQKRLALVADKLDFAFDLGLCENCGLPTEAKT